MGEILMGGWGTIILNNRFLWGPPVGGLGGGLLLMGGYVICSPFLPGKYYYMGFYGINGFF